jgi:hypothetical protein
MVSSSGGSSSSGADTVDDDGSASKPSWGTGLNLISRPKRFESAARMLSASFLKRGTATS